MSVFEQFKIKYTNVSRQSTTLHTIVSIDLISFQMAYLKYISSLQMTLL